MKVIEKMSNSVAKVECETLSLMAPDDRLKFLKKLGCPNCDIELSENYVGGWHPEGQQFKKWLQCGVCSFGYPLDWRED